MEEEKFGCAPIFRTNGKQKQWEELTSLMNSYMIENEWNATDALNFMKGVLIKTAQVTGVKKHMFDKQCDSMKEDFERWSEKERLNGQ